MPKQENSNPKDREALSFESRQERPNWLGAAAGLVAGILIAVALLDFEPSQSIKNTTNPTDVNLVGIVGAEFSWWSFFLLGGTTWLLPPFLVWIATMSVRGGSRLIGARLAAFACSIPCTSALLSMQALMFAHSDVYPGGPGGSLGYLVYDSLLKDSLGVFGSALVFSVVNTVAFVFIITRDVGAEVQKLLAAFADWRRRRAERRAEEKETLRKLKEEAAKQKSPDATKSAVAAAVSDAVRAANAPKKLVVPKNPDPLTAEPRLTRAPIEPSPEELPRKATPKSTPAKGTGQGGFELNIVKPDETKKAKVTLPQGADKNYEYPPLNLLKEQAKVSAADSEEEHRQNAENLLRILAEFGVEVSLGEIHVGPVITRYEVRPAPGVRVEKISGLDKNIALGMRAQSVRILAPIPGKDAVGVEVPNQRPTPVGLRGILESEDWAHAKAELPIALGKDVSGKPLISDLTKMPHLLIAGATGSGKSVCVNAIVASVLYSKSPRDVRLIMVDPKVVELKVFNSLPHMLIPVVTEPKKVPAALKILLLEMERRYQIFARVNVRNIAGFNSRKRDVPPATPLPEQQGELTGMEAADDIEIPDHLPYIIAIIDELADLMMVAPAEIETNIARLAQLARAAGIHLIIATQRPSVNVITGVIKANLPSRIAFQVASQVDSRTILDGKGADTLIGRGDMLFSPPGSSRLVRAQGAFVGDEEVQAIVEFLKRNGPPQYDQSVQQQIDRAASEDDEEDESGDGDGEMGDDEELFRQAYAVLKTSRRASTSHLQRRLRIGYNRAARIMDLMEDKGIVGPDNGSSPREILVDLDTYQP